MYSREHHAYSTEERISSSRLSTGLSCKAKTAPFRLNSSKIQLNNCPRCLSGTWCFECFMRARNFWEFLRYVGIVLVENLHHDVLLCSVHRLGAVPRGWPGLRATWNPNDQPPCGRHKYADILIYIDAACNIVSSHVKYLHLYQELIITQSICCKTLRPGQFVRSWGFGEKYP